ncbi:unnamed protein product [Prunus armeniaca]|uniref:Uncharacterized protein n=1 Tax=Prunus armeniaca TaxID=36596 RepID=A0A6J5XS30_PRUAR|nr:hypothetical protein GBA52_019164 [Prunus armeniaca]CAB4315153.1 unnamed protein product [Prunus armeniaca]
MKVVQGTISGGKAGESKCACIYKAPLWLHHRPSTLPSRYGTLGPGHERRSLLACHPRTSMPDIHQQLEHIVAPSASASYAMSTVGQILYFLHDDDGFPSVVGTIAWSSNAWFDDCSLAFLGCFELNLRDEIIWI